MKWPQDDLDVAEAYRTGRVTFMGLTLRVQPGVLVPRPETEILGETIVELLSRRGDQPLRVVDMCCGSGNLACAIAARIPRAEVWACDLSETAVDLARRNADELGLSDRVRVLRGDLFAPLADLAGTCDAVACNPPYISTGKLAKDRAPLLEQEPREAFDGGPYGVSIYLRVIREAPAYLKSGGLLAFEVGLAQGPQLSLLIARSGAFSEPSPRLDRSGNVRVLIAEKKEK